MKDCAHLTEWGNETEHPSQCLLKMYASAVVKLRVESLHVLEEVVGVSGKNSKETWIKYAERAENDGARVRQTTKTNSYMVMTN